MSLGLLALLPIIPVVVVLFVLLILANHPLHDLHASFERGGVSSASWISLFSFPLLVSYFLVVLIFLLELFDVGIPDCPLGDFSSQVVSDGRTGGCSSLLDRRINRLDLPVFIVEFVLHGLFDGLDILPRARLFLLGLPFDLLKLGLAFELDFFLDLVLIGGCMDVVSFEAEVHDELVNGIVGFIFALKVVIHDPIGLCLRIGHHQGPRDCQVEFCGREAIGLCDFLSVLKCT